MIEKEIVDRVPLYPGRITLNPVEGHTNTYDMFRADEPEVVGTPINKATLDSITQSRLTGRYYTPTVSKTVDSNATYTVNPIPTSGWVESGTEKATSGVYVTTASLSQSNPFEAFDGTWSTNGGWRPAYDDNKPWIAIDLGAPIVLKKVRIYFISDAWATTCTLAGSNNGTSWTNIATVNRPTTNGAIDWSFNNSVSYQHYRLTFDNTGIKLYGWSFTEYTVTSYNNVYTVADGFPTVWTTGQIALVSVPSNAVTLGVVRNALNGVTVNTILQPNKRYELRYTGSAFAAKEV